MAYVITEPCIDVNVGSCSVVCPVNCIYEGDRMNFINPDECIDCGLCEEICPTVAIFPEDVVPGEWLRFIELNRELDYSSAPRAFTP